MQNIFKSKKVIITGHTGFKGSWLSIWLNELGADVVGVSLDPPTEPSLFNEANLSSIIEDYRIDIRNFKNLESIISKIQPDFVFHLAAQPLVKKSYSNPIETHETNFIGSLNVLESIRTSIQKKCIIIMVTSDKCYKNNEWIWGYKETDEMGGLDPYSASKSATEILIKSHIHSYFPKSDNIKIGIVRAGNVIGGGDWASDRIVPDVISSWNTNKKLIIRNPFSTRPWQHVLEPLSGYISLSISLYESDRYHGEPFNFGPSTLDNYTVEDLIKGLSQHLDNLNWSYHESSNNTQYESNLLKLNCEKAHTELKWKPSLTFKQTVQMTADWYSHFYKNKDKTIFDLTKDQIKFYQSILEK